MKPFAGFQCKAVVVVPTDMVCSQYDKWVFIKHQITLSYGGINYNCLGLGVSATSFCSGGRRRKRGDIACQSFCFRCRCCCAVCPWYCCWCWLFDGASRQRCQMQRWSTWKPTLFSQRWQIYLKLLLLKNTSYSCNFVCRQRRTSFLRLFTPNLPH